MPLLRRATLLVLVLILLIVSAQTVGALIAPNSPARLHFITVDAQLGVLGWCWRTLCLGQTSYDDALAFLTDHHIESYSPLSTTTWKDWMNGRSAWQVNIYQPANRDQPIRIIAFYAPSKTLEFADLIRMYGTPLAVSLCSYADYVGSGPVVMGSAVFNNGVHVHLYELDNHYLNRATPRMIVDSVYMFPLDVPRWENISWRGFAVYPPDCV